MKRIYIKPTIEAVEVCPLTFIAGSKTEWHTGTDGEGDDHTVGPEQPDPNADAKGAFGFDDLWGDY